MPISGVEPCVSALVLPYTHRTIVQDLNRVICFEKFRARTRRARKMQFCTLGRVPAHAHQNLRFDNTTRFSSHFNDDRAQKFSHN